MTTSSESVPASMPMVAFALVLATVGIVAGVAGLIFGVKADTPGAAAGATPGGETAAAAPVETSIPIELNEFSITGDLIAAPGTVTFEVLNTGSVEHNLVVSTGDRTANLAGGGSENLVVGPLGAGTYDIVCDIPGHKEAGMTAKLLVAAAAATPPADSGDGGDHGGHGAGEDKDWAMLDAQMIESMLEYPAETEGRGNAPLEPTILPDGTKEFELVAQIVEWEVEPGKFVEAWTYNGIVPGPELRVDVGDQLRIVVRNELPLGTDVHWHGLSVPFEMDGVAPYTQDLIKTGETFVYEFEAEVPSIGMYHAHAHGHMKVPNGMFGVFIIGDTPIPYGKTVSGRTIPEELELAAEIPMVLNDAGTIGFSLNGKSFPATEPVVLKDGDWAVFHYYNEGLMPHPMHLHQFPQLVFAKDGIPLDVPYYADTINVAPGERYSVLVHADRVGTWVWHCHILTHVEREDGMFGMATAVVVEEDT